MAIVNGSLQEGYKDAAWFAANPTLVLLVGQKVNLEQTGTYKLGDGTTQLSALSFLGGSGSGLSGLTTNKVLKATSSTTAGDSNITDDGTNVYVNGLRIRNISNATYFNASGVNGHYWNSFNDDINLFRVKNDGVLNIPQGTSDRIMALDTNKDVVYLSTTIYPSLTELSYGKGVTSPLQTQLDGLAPIASPTFTGTATSPILVISGTGGNGYINVSNQSTTPTTPASSTQNIYTNSLGKLSSIMSTGTVSVFRGKIYSDLTTSSALTGSVANTLMKSGLVKGNTFSTSATDTVRVEALLLKTGTVGTVTQRYYVNTSNTLSGATLIGTSGATGVTATFVSMVRNGIIKSTTSTEFFSTGTVAQTDEALNGAGGSGGITSVNIDWTVDQYIIQAAQNSNSGDSTVSSYLKIYRD